MQNEESDDEHGIEHIENYQEIPDETEVPINALVTSHHVIVILAGKHRNGTVTTMTAFIRSIVERPVGDVIQSQFKSKKGIEVQIL